MALGKDAFQRFLDVLFGVHFRQIGADAPDTEDLAHGVLGNGGKLMMKDARNVRGLVECVTDSPDPNIFFRDISFVDKGVQVGPDLVYSFDIAPTRLNGNIDKCVVRVEIHGGGSNADVGGRLDAVVNGIFWIVMIEDVGKIVLRVEEVHDSRDVHSVQEVNPYSGGNDLFFEYRRIHSRFNL